MLLNNSAILSNRKDLSDKRLKLRTERGSECDQGLLTYEKDGGNELMGASRCHGSLKQYFYFENYAMKLWIPEVAYDLVTIV